MLLLWLLLQHIIAATITTNMHLDILIEFLREILLNFFCHNNFFSDGSPSTCLNNNATLDTGVLIKSAVMSVWDYRVHKHFANCSPLKGTATFLKREESLRFFLKKTPYIVERKLLCVWAHVRLGIYKSEGSNFITQALLKKRFRVYWLPYSEKEVAREKKTGYKLRQRTVAFLRAAKSKLFPLELCWDQINVVLNPLLPGVGKFERIYWKYSSSELDCPWTVFVLKW